MPPAMPCRDDARTAWRMRVRWFSALLLPATMAASSLAADGTQRQAENFLRREMNLVRVGKVWALTDEVQLQRRLGRLNEFRQNVLQIEKRLQQRIEENRKWWRLRVQAELQLRSLTTKGNGDDAQRRVLTARVEALSQKAHPPDQLGEAPDVRQRLIELTDARHDLALSIEWIRNTLPQLKPAYDRLHRDVRVIDALKQFGGDNQLGPLKKSYVADRKRLAQYERIVYTDHLPLYRQGGRLRVGAILNERFPVTFSWQEEGGPTLLTAAALEAAGLEINDDAPRVRLRLARRRLMVRRITIPYLRCGRYVLHNVAALVLPPEGEYLGARISRAAFTGYRVSLHPEQLRITIQPSN